MTAICGGGTSSPKVGASAVVLVGSGTIATMLEKSGNPWLAFAAALLTLPELVLSTFCSTDPPAMPTFTSAESSALLNVTFGADLSSGLVKFAALVQNLAWQEYCQCTSGALIVPAPVAPPAGTPIYQAPTPQAASPCYSLPSTSYILTLPSGNNFTPYFPPAGQQPTSAVLKFTSSTSFGSGTSQRVGVQVANGVTLTDILDPATFVTGASGTVIIPIPAGYISAVYPHNETVAGGGTGTTIGNLSCDIYCNGALPNGQVPAPCCPPDVATQSSLDLILKMVTLIQRQIAPFGYVPGAVHAGISGNGQIAVAGLLGVAVDVTTLPGRAGRTSGDPTQLYNVGWINTGTADGWGPRQFISSDPFILRPVSGDVTLIGYSIPADVVVTITGLVREP
jgi:hypothetical protein